MPIDNSQRAEHIRGLNSTPAHTNSTQCNGIARMFPPMVRGIRNSLMRFDRRFDAISGADAAAKQTTFFDCIAAEPDGALILHDFGIMLDAMLVIANDNRQPGEDALTIPFTDADVTAYLA